MQGFAYANGPEGIYSDAAGCGTVFENNVIKIIYMMSMFTTMSMLTTMIFKLDQVYLACRTQ